MTAASAPRLHRMRWDRSLWGLALIALGAVWLADRMGAFDVTYVVVGALLLLAVAVALPLAPAADRGGVFGLGLVLSIVLLVAVLASPITGPVVSGGVGELQLRPTAADLEPRYEHGIGDLEMDLRAVDLVAPGTGVDVELGVGNLVVRVPSGVPVDVTADSGIGEVMMFGDRRGGFGVSARQQTGSSEARTQLRIDASVGIGKVEVTR